MTRRSHPGRVFGALALACSAYGLSQVLVTPALPDIARELDTTIVGATSVVSVFFVAGAATVGIVGRLGDMFGKQRVLAIMLGVFVCGAIVCALSPTLAPLLAGRVLMGCAACAFPLGMSILREELPPERVARSIGLLSAILGAGATLGFVAGGVIADQLGYRWIFWISVINGILALTAVALLVPPSSLRSPGRIDFLGAALFAGGVAVPLFAISQAANWGWLDSHTVTLVAVGLCFLALFVLHERRHPAPLLDLGLLRRPQVALTNGATALVGFAMIGVTAVIAQFVQEPTTTGYGFGTSPAAAGFFFVPGTICLLFVSTLGGRLSASKGAKLPLMIGCASGTLALVMMAFVHGNPLLMYIWPALLSSGIGFAWAAMPLLILAAVPQAQSGESTGMNFVFRNTGSAIGAQLAATLITVTIGVDGRPSEAGYTHAFLTFAGAATLALVLSVLIPGRGKLPVAHRDPTREAVATPG